MKKFLAHELIFVNIFTLQESDINVILSPGFTLE